VEKMGLNRRIAVLAIVIAAVIGSGLVASGAFAAVTNTGSAGSPPDSSTATHWRHGTGNMTRPPWQGNMTRSPWQGNVTVTSEQANTIVSDAVNAFQIGEVKDGGSVWMVSIKYNDKVVMTVLLGKLNTPTSGDALKAVQDSIGKGWSAGEPKQHGFTYNVPIIDSNGNPIGNIRVDGRTGDITAGFSQGW
jgi:uncharacterized membrane protein YdfJ with MMPL/SSD domain